MFFSRKLPALQGLCFRQMKSRITFLYSLSIKFDGTNIAKDNDGTLYSRRFVMDKEATKFQHTSLEEVNKADIQLVKRLILKDADIEEILISKTITFGELICNRYYDYITSDKFGKWLNFGVKLQVVEAGKNGKNVLDKLVKNGFAAQSNIQDGFIKIFPNIKLCQIFQKANMDAVPCESEKEITFDLILRIMELLSRITDFIIHFLCIYGIPHTFLEFS